MKKSFFKMGNIIFLILFFSFLTAFGGWAQSFKKPVVVRKKIIIPKNNPLKIKDPVRSNSRLKKHPLKPK